LLDGFFVDVAVFLEGFVDFVEAFDGLERGVVVSRIG